MIDKEKYVLFADANIGDKISRPVFVAQINEGNAKNNKPFVKITLKDGSTDQVATMFDTSAADLDMKGIRKNTIADVRLDVSEYQGSKNFKVLSIAPTTDENITVEDFVRVPPVDMELMFNEICALIEDSANDYDGKYDPISQLALDILNEHKEKYMASSAAVAMHHNLRGGLLYHSYRMVKSADALCAVYTHLDRELLICGAALHDIGKIWEYNTTQVGDAEFTPSGVLLGHIYMGASLIKGYTQEKNYSREKVQLLIHLILSHHGTHEWGAVTVPATPEAYVLHYIDNIDAKLYVCEENYAVLGSGEINEKKPLGMEGRLYKPNIR